MLRRINVFWIFYILMFLLQRLAGSPGKVFGRVNASPPFAL
jgi:hypothetical protein